MENELSRVVNALAGLGYNKVGNGSPGSASMEGGSTIGRPSTVRRKWLVAASFDK
jgi:hypothetical protein